jgi:hypothetical protein
MEGNRLRGLVDIINDGDMPMTVGAIKTSCGCTAAKPLVDQVPKARKTAAIIDYQPNEVGEQQVRIEFTLNDNTFVAAGKAKTLPWFSAPSLVDVTRDKQVVIDLKATRPTKLVRIDSPDGALQSLVQQDNQIQCVLMLDSEPEFIRVVPRDADRAYPMLSMRANYLGKVTVMPRHLLISATTHRLRYMLRGDIVPLLNAKQITIGDQPIPITIQRVTHSLARVEFDYPLALGDHKLEGRLTTHSLTFRVIVR